MNEDNEDTLCHFLVDLQSGIPAILVLVEEEGGIGIEAGMEEDRTEGRGLIMTDGLLNPALNCQEEGLDQIHTSPTADQLIVDMGMAGLAIVASSTSSSPHHHQHSSPQNSHLLLPLPPHHQLPIPVPIPHPNGRDGYNDEPRLDY
ncbi:hypothetical protein KEM48_002302 [Puccinia striiformis f. sp. tritici PST-130]|nr:hypothetical protein KEM48_002302 [Puccinia striiformis f. sp. tritici PST-130]